MASFIFRRLPSDTRQRRYSVEYSPLGRGLGRRPQSSGEEQMKLVPGRLNDAPQGTDTKALRQPRLGT